MYYIAILFAIAIVTALMALNIWYHRHRRTLTPDELAREEDEVKVEMRVW